MKRLHPLLGLSIPILLLSLLITTTTSCKKVEGCTDNIAKNYDALAEVDDGSCTYEGKVVFWYIESVSDYLINQRGITSLSYSVEGELEGSSSSSVFYNYAPDCGDNGTITVIRDLGTSKSKQYSYKVEDPIDGEVVWEGVITFEANNCVVFQLDN